MAWYAYERVILKKNSKRIECLGLTVLAFPISFFIKSNLQLFFGRISPRYYENTQLLFVKNPHLYGFHLFQGGSFPSGHMCVFTPALLIISYFYPKLKPWCYALLAILAFLLLFYNYHFLSDVISGIYIGTLIAFTMIRINEERVPTNGLYPLQEQATPPQSADIK